MLSPFYLPRVGGVERHVAGLSAAPTRRGHAVEIVTAHHAPGLETGEVVDGIAVRRFHPSPLPLMGPLVTGLRLLPLAGLLRGADVLHCHDYPTFRWILLWRLLLPRKRIAITFHGWEGHAPPKRSALWNRRLAARLTRGNLCVGSFIEKWYGTRATDVTYGAVSTEAEGPGIPSDVLLLSRIEPDVPVSAYLEGFAALKATGGGQRDVVVVGGGSLLDEMKRRAESLGVPIRIVGAVADAQPYLRGTRVVVANGFLAILEAVSYGKPVFAIYTDPIMEDRLRLFPHAESFIHAFSDPGAFGAALADNLARSEADRGIPGEAVAWARAQTWDRLADQYEEIWSR